MLNIVKNKGTGAGGAKTNKNGSAYEKKTNLTECIRNKQILQEYKNTYKLKFNGCRRTFISTKKREFIEIMKILD
jgi:hypothetical protein